MSLIEIKKVETKKDLKTFIDFHYDLYEGNEYDVPNLFSDDMNTLSKDKNAAFEFCEAEYFLAYKDGKLAGRVAAIINHKANNKWGRKSVRFGWIDFIDDREVSKALLDAVEKYGKEKGMEDIVGPLGFTDMDPEGMLTWGFDELGTHLAEFRTQLRPCERQGEQGECREVQDEFQTPAPRRSVGHERTDGFEPAETAEAPACELSGGRPYGDEQREEPQQPEVFGICESEHYGRDFNQRVRNRNSTSSRARAAAAQRRYSSV